MDPRELDILISLDAELPITDPDALALRARVRGLVGDDATADRLTRGYQDGIRRFADRQAGNTDPATRADIEVLFGLVHDTVPAGTDPAVVSALDELLARLLAIGANIAGGPAPAEP